MSLKWLWLFFWLTGPTNQNRPTANRFDFYVFSTIEMKFGIWIANAPALLLLFPCSCIGPGRLLACSQPAPALPLILPTPVLQPSSSSALYDFFRHGESRLLWYHFFGYGYCQRTCRKPIQCTGACDYYLGKHGYGKPHTFVREGRWGMGRQMGQLRDNASLPPCRV